MDLMYKVMMDDHDAIEKMKVITCMSEKLATRCAEDGLDIWTMCGLMATMIDKYQSITKIPHEDIYNAWDFAKKARDSVNAVCGDPLEMSGI